MNQLKPDKPPESGDLSFSVEAQPISLQGSSKRRRQLANAVRREVASTRFLLSGDVQVEIEWMVHERERYESVSSPDIDNVVKPFLDSICGPQGLLIDDCQVQAVSCSWIDWTRPTHRVTFRLRYHPDEWIPKDGLVFVHLQDGLCFPLDDRLSAEALERCLEVLSHMLSMKVYTQARTGDYYFARRFLPAQRLFHRARLQSFRVVEARDLHRSAKGGG